MSQQVFSRAERIRLFLRDYYFGHTKWINIVRLIGGPLVIFSGIQFYYKSDRAAIAYGGFCILYGVYYLLKPILIIAVRPALVQPLNSIVLLDGQVIKWQENGNESFIQFSSFQKIQHQTGYYSLKLPNKVAIYLRANQLTETEKLLMNKHLTAN